MAGTMNCAWVARYTFPKIVLGTLRVLPIFYFKIHETTYGIWVFGKGDDKISYSCPIRSPQSQTFLALESLETDGDAYCLPWRLVPESTFCVITPLVYVETTQTGRLLSQGLPEQAKESSKCNDRSLLGVGLHRQEKGTLGPMVNNAIWQTQPCLVIWEEESKWGPEYISFSAFWGPR